MDRLGHSLQRRNLGENPARQYSGCRGRYGRHSAGGDQWPRRLNSRYLKYHGESAGYVEGAGMLLGKPDVLDLVLRELAGVVVPNQTRNSLLALLAQSAPVS